MIFFKFGQSSWPSFTFKEDFLNIFHFIISFFQALSKRFFLSVFFFTNIDDSKDRRGRGKAIYLSSFYHFHWLCKYLGIIRAITLEISTLHMASSWTETTNLLFPSICRHPLSYAFHRQIINYKVIQVIFTSFFPSNSIVHYYTQFTETLCNHGGCNLFHKQCSFEAKTEQLFISLRKPTAADNMHFFVPY